MARMGSAAIRMATLKNDACMSCLKNRAKGVEAPHQLNVWLRTISAFVLLCPWLNPGPKAMSRGIREFLTGNPKMRLLS